MRLSVNFITIQISGVGNGSFIMAAASAQESNFIALFLQALA
jgi:hypothetical protein